MNFSPEKLFIVGIIALVVLGPNRLPQAAKTAARLLAEYRKVVSSLQNEVTSAIAEPRNALNQAVGEFGIGDMRNSLRNTLNDVVNGATAAATAPATNGNAVAGAVGQPADAPIRVANPAEPIRVVDETAPLATPSTGVRATPLVPDDPSLN